MPKPFNRAIKLAGESAKPGSSTVVQVLEYDVDDNVLKATGTTVPSGEAGYAIGAEFIKTNGTAGGIVYRNQGTTSSCSFVSNSSSASVAAGSTLTMTAASHAGKTMQLDTASGSVVTLPASTGSGSIYRFYIKTKATSNSHIVKVANSSDIIQGSIFTQSDDAGNPVKGYFAGATDDTITLNRTTTGSVNVGEYIELQDVATNMYICRGFTSSTGTEATPFSATV